MYEHEHYETLCAAAVAGQITEPEWNVLRAHLASCSSCTESLASFGRLSTDLIYEQASRPPDQQIAQLRKRFLKRAAAEGFSASRHQPFFEVPKRWQWSWWVGATVAATLVLFAALEFGISLNRRSTNRTGQTVVQTEAERLTPPLTTATPGAVQSPNGSGITAAKADGDENSLQQEVEQSNARSKAFEEEKSQLLTKLAEQRRELETRAALIAILKEERNTDTSRLADAQSSLEKAKSEKDATEVQFAVQQNEIRDLSEKLRLQSAQLDSDRALFGKNGQSILAARNLHIIDVYDADGNGKRRKSFGRLFYEEGKRLVFYAYDLSDASHPGPHFYAWGADKSDPHFVARLGILHNDGNGEGRWELTFENSGVLSKIDSVFVTAENKEVTKPKGRRVLFAVLGGAPNHP
jgi:anti-sigma factor RsiW